MSASHFVAQLRLARITDQFYIAYTQYVTKLLARERALFTELLGPDADAVRALDELGQPLTRERLAQFVEEMTEEQRVRFATTIAGGV